MLGLAYWCIARALRKGDGFAAYRSLSEPRSTDESDLAKNIQNMPVYVTDAFRAKGSNTRPTIAVLDSVGLAMRAYAGPENLKREGAMKEGMSVSDQLFCRDMQQASMRAGVVFGVVGQTEVPFVESLEGLVEGLVKIVSPGTFELTYRQMQSSGSARSAQQITCPSWAMDFAVRHLGYGDSFNGPDRNYR
jgi:hypothetical protein